MTQVERLAGFVAHATYESLSEAARLALRSRILDSLGCALGALDAEPIIRLRALLGELGGRPLATLIGGGRTAPDRAALYNAALVRYLDYNDGFLAAGESCHPSDSVGPVLAATEYAGGDGRDLFAALAVAYQVQCRLAVVAPVRERGFDHTVQAAYGVAAGVARALGLDAARTAHAVAIAGTALNALRVTRTGRLSQWKGLASAYAASGSTYAALLAMHGITGPLEVFEGNKGFMEAIAGHFEVEWAREDLEAVRATILKKFNAEIHAQSTIEGVLELRAAHHLAADDIERVEVEIFDVAYHIIGGGEEGDKLAVGTKEQADHSLPYLVAVALCDGEVTPAQYAPARIAAADVQGLLRRVIVRPRDDLSRRFPAEMPVVIRIVRRDGGVLAVEKRDYEGFVNRPMPWDAVVAKFERLAALHADAALRRGLVDAVLHLDTIPVRELSTLLGRAGKEGRP